MRLAYFASKFPATSETFILNEMISLTQNGCEVEAFAFNRPLDQHLHPQTNLFLESAHYPHKPLALLWAQLIFLARKPIPLVTIWFTFFRYFGTKPKLLLRHLAALLAGTHFARLISIGNFDHIHAHWANHTSFAAYCAAKLTGLPFSITAHANDIYVDQTMLDKKVREAAFMVTISEYNRSWIQQFVANDLHYKINVIRCGIDLNRFANPATKERSRPPILICVARLNEKKGHKFLLDACAQLAEQNYQFECRLIGTGELEPTLRNQVASLGLSESVKFKGALTQPEVIRQLEEADLMVLPSITLSSGRREGIPVSLMEGMAMGLPVVSTELSGIPELVRHEQTGLLVPEKDSPALASAMLRLLNDEAFAQRLADNGRALVLNEYNLDENSKQLLELFRQSSDTASSDLAKLQFVAGD